MRHWYHKRYAVERKRGIVGETIALALGIAALTAGATVGGMAIAGSGKKDSAPSLPALPTAPTTEQVAAATDAAALAQRRRAAGSGGSILTSPLGDTSMAPTAQKTLLGV